MWSKTEIVHRAIMVGYWLRPFDSHLDDRRWRWQESGCAASQRAWDEHVGSLPL